MNAIALRHAIASDEPFLRALFGTTREPLLQALQLPEAQAAVFCEMQFRAQAAGYRDAYPHAEYLVVCAGGEPIGRITRAFEEDHLVLVDIALMPAFRGQGIGASLITQLQGEAEALGVALVLSVEVSNPAFRLYHRMGFEVRDDDGAQLRLHWKRELTTTRGARHGPIPG